MIRPGPSPAGGRTRPAAPGLRRSGAVLAAATLIGNVFAYGLVVVLARVVPPDPLGAVGSLLNLSVIGSVPALAVQLVTARETARETARAAERPPEPVADEPDPTADEPAPADAALAGLVRPVLTLAVLVGVGLGLVTAAAAPFAVSFLRLDGLTAPLLVAAALPATAVLSAVQGLLQGAQRFSRLSLVLVGVAGLRLVGGGLGGLLDRGPVGVTAGLLVGTLLAAAAGVALLRRPGRPVRRPAPPLRRLLAEVAGSTVSTSGLLVLVNLDVLLARHVLPAGDSGAYTVGSLFAKAAFWGPAFVSTLLYARMSVELRRGRAVALGVALTAGVGGLAIAGTAFLGGPLVRVVGGSGYASLGEVVWLFAGLGSALAVTQVLVYARLAMNDQRLGAAAWVAGAVVTGIVLSLDRPQVSDVVTAALVGAAGLALAGILLERHLLRPVDPRR